MEGPQEALLLLLLLLLVVVVVAVELEAQQEEQEEDELGQCFYHLLRCCHWCPLTKYPMVLCQQQRGVVRDIYLPIAPVLWTMHE